jgi:hypothetical protein
MSQHAMEANKQTGGVLLATFYANRYVFLRYAILSILQPCIQLKSLRGYYVLYLLRYLHYSIIHHPAVLPVLPIGLGHAFIS